MTFLNMLLMLPQEVASDEGMVNALVVRFNEGGSYMWPVLISLIIGLAISFERIITLNRADINTRKFIVKVKGALEGVELRQLKRFARERVVLLLPSFKPVFCATTKELKQWKKPLCRTVQLR